jgi:hypothetical protein
VQNLSYVWDTAGNPSNREDLLQYSTFAFAYDTISSLNSRGGTPIQTGVVRELTAKTPGEL